MEYIKGAELPNQQETWEDENGNPIDFSSGYTFTARLYDPYKETLWLTKTTGFTGSAGTNNFTVLWDINELDINAGDYLLIATATRTSDSKKYKKSFPVRIAINGEAPPYIPEPELYGVPAGINDNDILVWDSATEQWLPEAQTSDTSTSIVFAVAL